MAQTLDEFLQEARGELLRFEKYWLEKHSTDPKQYPLAMEHANDGIWWEFLYITKDIDV